MTTQVNPEAMSAYLRRRSRPGAAQRDAELALKWDHESRRAKRLTGGRLDRDPRRPWRGGNMAVDRQNLWLMTHGFVDSPTLGEKIAAVNHMEGTLVEAEGWFERPHLITKTEMAARLGISVTGLRSARDKQDRLRQSRTERRMADRKWKDAVAAHAVGRKERARHVHGRLCALREARRAIWELRQDATGRGHRG